MTAAIARPHLRWDRIALGAILAVTAVIYLWGLGSLGWANEFYATAVQAGTQSWKAWLFGSLDAGNAITVDKPPVSLWAMGLSGRIFGFNTWSMLVPQALMGVATVALLYAAVRRCSGTGAGLIAATSLALTPVAALMFRYNNPDALLVLLMVAAAYCVVRAVEANPLRWTVLAGVAVGFAFLTKLMQALLVVPGMAAVLLLALPGSFWHRLRISLVGLAAMVVSGGWLLALVALWPAAARPYIGGSTDNSLLELALGYNGVGRIFGGSGNPTTGGGGPGGPGGVPGGPGGGPGGPGATTGHGGSGALAAGGDGGGFHHNGFGGSPGATRLFGDSMGAEISWLLPAALFSLIACLWLTRRAARTDLTRAALILWGSWLLVTGIVFSTMKGIMHPYYTVALAPAIAALVGIATTMLWARRSAPAARVVLAVMIAATGAWSFVLLARTPDWLPWLRWVLLVGAGLTVVALVLGSRRDRWMAAVAAFALIVGLGGTGAYTVATISQSHGSGSMPTSGPSRVDDGARGGDGHRPGAATAVSDQLIDKLTATNTRWAAATVGSHSSGALQLSSRRPIMAIGGFNGGDDAPTLAQFKQYVRDGQIAYFVVDDRGPGGSSHGPGRAPGGTPAGPGGAWNGRGGASGHQPGRTGSASAITEWVKATYTAQTVDGTTVYDLRDQTRTSR
ncbi:glycosyltransferase family 39 protein [uncultured Gordonia sp.]|uniref:glycosyltransferase family 39 protein n=2 Tax=Gordonia sp. (in: high G+C Gram-positive bacteria) TaxID=84139 RepID=UPI000FA2B633|nr:glycosyltransferase family 39 protein [uncultured Gordonia sp.]RUP36660.1 MAG: glycosyltransferase family 39 protein [Gordonia sp. (in: high G+C Gram-positive bacteria)]